MPNTPSLDKILFLDVETVPAYPKFKDMPERLQQLWSKKAGFLAKQNETPDELFPRAGIYAEFGKVICISAGFLVDEGKHYQLRIKSFYGDEEEVILGEFADLLNQHFSSSQHSLCAHNGKEFDFPYLSRRMIVQGVELPFLLDNSGKKPWEISLLDTMEMWKFGDFKSFTSLDLLAALFNLPSPKENMDGSEVYPTYYQDKDLEKIKTYCEGDVRTLAQVYLKMVQANKEIL